MGVLRYYLLTAVVVAAIAGLWFGGGWVWLGITTFPVLMALDLLLPPDLKKRKIPRIPFLADVPMYLHLPLLAVAWSLFVARLASLDGAVVFLPGGAVTAPQVIGMVLSIGWIGAVPNVPVSHELWHRKHPFQHLLGKVCATFYLDPNRDVGHTLTHHLELCTPADSDTPRRGQNIYSFVWQASYGAYKDGVVTTTNALRKRDVSIFHPKNAAYLEFLLLGVLLGLVYLGAGLTGVGVALAAMVFSKLLAEGFNYLQHYGMVRVPGTPIRHYHAWNHLGAIVRPLAMEITNHMNHHFDSRYKFYELEPRKDGAQMPSAFLCFVLALVPPLWMRYIAKPRLRHWDENFATAEEKRLAMEANRKTGWPEWVSVPPASAAKAVSP